MSPVLLFGYRSFALIRCSDARDGLASRDLLLARGARIFGFFFIASRSVGGECQLAISSDMLHRSGPNCHTHRCITAARKSLWFLPTALEAISQAKRAIA